MPPFVVIWIWLCAYLNCAGWTLSALHQLNAAGYAVALALGLAALLVWSRTTGRGIRPTIYWPKLRHRFARGFPLAFLILASLALLGGALHGPTNYDALAYRTPRVLHWLAADQWHWIHTIFDRLNSRACAFEWVSAPLIALIETDRLLFLINMVSLLLLPGLVFSFFTRLGVRRRAAWHWMWLVPTGYCFLLQAGSIGNDLFGAVFALAAMDYALRAAKTGAAGDIAVSVLAAALMVGNKFGNVPLLLPWGAAIFPVGGKILRRPVWALAVGLIALLGSGLPIMVANQIKLHDWSGAGISRNGPKTDMFWRFADNCALLPVQNLAPPVFPFSKRWHDFVQSHIPARINAHLNQAMLESGATQFEIPEMQMEESAGLGFGVSLLALAAFAAARPWRRGHFPPAGDWSVRAARWLPWVALLAVLTQSGMSALARL
ncbi:MAG TPA: hypothetical protein VL527_12255, partial [Dongiaceae bacterium]|nr:hypothetical protein [Dongiaceae bacterium]